MRKFWTVFKIATVTCVGVVLIGAISFYVWFLFETRDWYRSFIPEQIGVEELIQQDTNSGLVSGCGAVTFQMMQSTADAINQQGLAFLADATRARGQDLVYSEWHQVSTGGVLTARENGFDCAEKIGSELSKLVADSAKKSGSYFATTLHGMVVVLPHRRLVIFTYEK
jgi:hypothetical protein